MNRRRVLLALVGASLVVAAITTVALFAPRPPGPQDAAVEVDGYRVLDQGRLRLGYSPVTESCGGGPLHTPVLAETSSAVEVRLTQTVTPGVAECSAYAEIGRVDVVLSSPLGERRVVDGTTGEVVPAGLVWTPYD